MKETRALAYLRKLYPKGHFQVVGGCATGGVLDVNCCFDGVEVWVELKQYKRPKTAKGKIQPSIMRGQPAWSELRRRAGGKTFVGIMVGSDFYLLPGSCLIELFHSGITQQRLEDLKLDEKTLFR